MLERADRLQYLTLINKTRDFKKVYAENKLNMSYMCNVKHRFSEHFE